MATTLFTCAALQANEHEKQQQEAQGNPPGQQTGQSTFQTERTTGIETGKHGQSAQDFVQKAMMSSQIEIQMGQLGQERAQDPEVKSLASALVRDHQQASQRLQQLAAHQNVQAGAKDDHAKKHDKALEKLRSASGAEFDKEFVKAVLKHHKKDIKEFEKCQQEIQDAQIKAFIDETLPKLRNHLQLARNAARTVGVDEASIAAEMDLESDTAVGAPAGGVRGTERTDDPLIDNRLDGATDVDASGTINQNVPQTDRDLDVDLDADATLDADDATIEADADTGGVFEKGDGKILGLPTDKNDGKFLGIIPNPRADKDDDADVDVDVDVEADTDPR